MSLTSLLNEKGVFYDRVVGCINQEVLNRMAAYRLPLRLPYIKDSMPAAVGMGARYCLMNQSGKLQEMFSSTVAGNICKKMLNGISPDWDDQPKAMLQCAFADSLYRTADTSSTAKLSGYVNGQLKPQMQPAYQDMSNVCESIAKLFEGVNLNARVVCNPTYTVSDLLGGCDGALIIGDTCFVSRVTNKRQPLDQDWLVKQLCYFIFSNNDYDVTKMQIILPKQSEVICLNMSSIFIKRLGMVEVEETLIESNYELLAIYPSEC